MYVVRDQSKLSSDASGWTSSRDLHRSILGQSEVSSAYLHKLEKERERHDEVLSKTFRNIPVHIRRMMDPHPDESLTIRRWVALPRSTPCRTKRKLKSQGNRSKPSQSSPRPCTIGQSSEGPGDYDKGQPYKVSTRRRNDESNSLGGHSGESTTCACAKMTSEDHALVNSRKGPLGPCPESSEDSNHNCSQISQVNPRSSSYESDEIFAINQVPFKCPALSSSKKKNCCVPSRLDSQIALRKAMRSQIEKQRNSAVSSHVQFVNCNSLHGTHVGPPSGPCKTKLITRGYGTDNQLTDQSIELLAILSVQEHNVPMCGEEEMETAGARE